MPSLGQLRCQGINDALDKARKLDEQFHQRLCLDDLRLSERYAKSKLHLLVHFRIGGIDEEFVAHLQRKEDILWSEETCSAPELSRRRTLD